MKIANIRRDQKVERQREALGEWADRIEALEQQKADQAEIEELKKQVNQLESGAEALKKANQGVIAEINSIKTQPSEVTKDPQKNPATDPLEKHNRLSDIGFSRRPCTYKPVPLGELGSVLPELSF